MGKEFKSWSLPKGAESAEIVEKARDLISLVYGLLESQIKSDEIPPVVMLHKLNNADACEVALTALQHLGFEIKVDSNNPDTINISSSLKPGFLIFENKQAESVFREEVKTALLNIKRDSIPSAPHFD